MPRRPRASPAPAPAAYAEAQSAAQRRRAGRFASRLHADRRAHEQRRRQHLVDAGGAPAIAVLQRPVLPPVLRRRPLHRAPRRQRRLRRDHLGRRLRPDQQPRGRRAHDRGQRHPVGQARAQGQIDRLRRRDRPRAAEDRRRQPPHHRLGRLVAVEGRGVGAGDRQSLSARPDRHARHRQRHQPQLRERVVDRRLHPDGRGDQSGQLGRRADQPARRAGRHQHLDLFARAAAIRASASPCRATSRARCRRS